MEFFIPDCPKEEQENIYIKYVNLVEHNNMANVINNKVYKFSITDNNEIITKTVGERDSKNNSIIIIILECSDFFKIFTKLGGGYKVLKENNIFTVEYFNSSLL